MRIAVASIGSFDKQYSDFHIMRDLILEMLKRGHNVVLIQKQYLDKPLYPAQFQQYLGLKLEIINIRFEDKSRANLVARYLADVLYYQKVCRLIKKQNPDKIFLQSNNTAFFTVFYAKHVLKKPLFYNEQDIFPENALFAGIIKEKSLVYCIAHAFQRYVYQNATELSTISDDMKDTIVSRYHIPEEKVHVIYNWGHEELMAHCDAENVFLKKYPKKACEFRVLYAGNLGKMQNVESILAVAELMRAEENVAFYIVGNGVNEEQLISHAKERKLKNVFFVDMQPPEDVADLYASADVNVIPLQKGLIYAALPSKTADCLIAGKPIITCVDSDSRFSELIQQCGAVNTAPNSPMEVRNILLQIKSGQLKSAERKNLYFQRSINVNKFLQLLERMS